MIDTMTDNAINERLARFCGWEYDDFQRCWFWPSVAKPERDGLPWYTNDGNAMLELLEALRAKGLAYRAESHFTDEIGDPETDPHKVWLSRPDGRVSVDVSWAEAAALPRAVALAAIKVIKEGL